MASDRHDPERGQNGPAPDGRLDLHVDPDEPNGDWVERVEYVYLTGEGYEDLTPSEYARLLQMFGPDAAAIAHGEVAPHDDDEPDAQATASPIEQLDK